MCLRILGSKKKLKTRKPSSQWKLRKERNLEEFEVNSYRDEFYLILHDINLDLSSVPSMHFIKEVFHFAKAPFSKICRICKEDISFIFREKAFQTYSYAVRQEFILFEV